MISALNKFKETAIGKAAVAVVAAPLLIGAFAGAANAGDGKIAYHKFKSDRTPDFMNLAAATASTGRYALFVTGSNDVVLREVYKLALHIEKTTPYEVFFLHSNRSGPISDINLLVNGQIVTEVEVGGNIAEMKQALNQGFRTGSERLAKAETPKDPDVS